MGDETKSAVVFQGVRCWYVNAVPSIGYMEVEKGHPWNKKDGPHELSKVKPPKFVCPEVPTEEDIEAARAIVEERAVAHRIKRNGPWLAYKVATIEGNPPAFVRAELRALVHEYNAARK